jgi:hypothetical protein
MNAETGGTLSVAVDGRFSVKTGSADPCRFERVTFFG